MCNRPAYYKSSIVVCSGREHRTLEGSTLSEMSELRCVLSRSSHAPRHREACHGVHFENGAVGPLGFGFHTH